MTSSSLPIIVKSMEQSTDRYCDNLLPLTDAFRLSLWADIAHGLQENHENVLRVCVLQTTEAILDKRTKVL